MISNSTEYDLVVITPSEFSASLQPLIDHKNGFGLMTTLMTTEEIYAGYPGRDEAEQIKYFIKDALETLGADYVLFVGSIYKVPMRISMVSLWHFEGDTLTDLYYSDIYDAEDQFSSWDTNNNDNFGEDEDEVDLYPDVHIGRLACDSIEEVEVVVDKIRIWLTNINYQLCFLMPVLLQNLISSCKTSLTIKNIECLISLQNSSILIHLYHCLFLHGVLSNMRVVEQLQLLERPERHMAELTVGPGRYLLNSFQPMKAVKRLVR